MTKPEKHVLIVEDDRDYGYVLATRCQLLGLKSTLIHDAQGALEHLLSRKPDLLILDVNIPFQSGAVAAEHGAYMCSQLRHTVLKNVKTIMLSGSSDVRTILRCQQSGSVFIQKSPGSWGLLERTIRLLLGPPTGDSSLPRELECGSRSPAADGSPAGVDFPRVCVSPTHPSRFWNVSE